MGNLRCFPSLNFPLLASVWLTTLSIFTLGGGFGCLTPFSSVWVPSSSWRAWIRLALWVALFLLWHTLWKCPILWQSLHLAFFAGHLCPGWCSCFPHLMHLSSIPEGFLEWWPELEDLCSPDLFCARSFQFPLFFLLFLPLFCPQSYAAKLTDDVETNWFRLLWWVLQSSISNCCIRKSNVSSFPSSFIKLMAMSLAFVLFMPKNMVSLMALSSSLVEGNLHLFTILVMWAWNSPNS